MSASDTKISAALRLWEDWDALLWITEDVNHIRRL